MTFQILANTAVVILAGLGLYAFGAHYKDPTFYGFSYTLIGGGLGYIGGFLHGQTKGS